MTRCPACNSPIEAKQNPYYGAGLSVHELILDCANCKQVTFVPSDRADASPLPRAKARRLLARIFRRAR